MHPDAKRKERKAKKEEQKKKLSAAAAKRRAKLPQIADGANPYLNPNKKAGLPLPGEAARSAHSRIVSRRPLLTAWE